MIKIEIPQSQPDQLTINDVPLYPSLPLFPPQPILAKQVESDVSLADFRTSEAEKESAYKAVRLGFVSVVEKTVDAAQNTDKAELMTLEFQVASLEDKPVHGLEKIKVTMLKTKEGQLGIARVDLEPAAPENRFGQGLRCHAPPILCKLKALMMGGLLRAKMALHRCHHHMRLPVFGFHRHHNMHHHGGKPCRHHHGMHRGMPHSMPGLPVVAPMPHLEVIPVNVATIDDQMHHLHLEHPHHHQGHHFTSTVARMVMHILVPVLIGVAAGMTASLVGMIVGQVVVVLWRRFYRRNGGRYSSVTQEEDGSIDDGASDGPADEKPFLDEEGLPAYDVNEAVEIVEKKE